MSAQPFANIRIVLVNTSHPGNIGGAARAMKNMGLSRLYLVAPQEYPSDKAVWRSAGATDVLDNAVVVETLDEAIAGCSLVVGTSARERRIPWPLLDPRQCGESVWAEAASHEVALVFGREDRGLTNEELHKCNYHVHIPANPDYSSLNLAMAVQIVTYEVRVAALAAKPQLPTPDDTVYPSSEQMERFYLHLEQTLNDTGFIIKQHPGVVMTKLKRLFTRARPEDAELNILRGILTSMQRKHKLDNPTE